MENTTPSIDMVLLKIFPGKSYSFQRTFRENEYDLRRLLFFLLQKLENTSKPKERIEFTLKEYADWIELPLEKLQELEWEEEPYRYTNDTERLLFKLFKFPLLIQDAKLADEKIALKTTPFPLIEYFERRVDDGVQSYKVGLNKALKETLTEF